MVEEPRCPVCGEPLVFHGPEGECPDRPLVTDDEIDARDLEALDRGDVEWD